MHLCGLSIGVRVFLALYYFFEDSDMGRLSQSANESRTVREPTARGSEKTLRFLER